MALIREWADAPPDVQRAPVGRVDWTKVVDELEAGPSDKWGRVIAPSTTAAGVAAFRLRDEGIDAVARGRDVWVHLRREPTKGELVG